MGTVHTHAQAPTHTETHTRTHTHRHTNTHTHTHTHTDTLTPVPSTFGSSICQTSIGLGHGPGHGHQIHAKVPCNSSRSSEHISQLSCTKTEKKSKRKEIIPNARKKQLLTTYDSTSLEEKIIFLGRRGCQIELSRSGRIILCESCTAKMDPLV